MEDYNEKPQEQNGGLQGFHGFRDWFSKIPEDNMRAIKQAALVTGLSMMSQGPSNRPVSAAETIGRAGMMGLQQYNTSMDTAKKDALAKTEMGLKLKASTREDERLGLDKSKEAREAAMWAAPEEGETLVGTGLPPAPASAAGAGIAPPPVGPGLNVPAAPMGDGLTKRGKGGLMYQKTQADIEAQQVQARRGNWGVDSGYLINRDSGEKIKLDSAKRYKNHTDIGGEIVVFYDDGTKERIKKTADPTKASGADDKVSEVLLRKVASGAKLTPGEEEAWSMIDREEKLVNAAVINYLSEDPDFRDADDKTQMQKIRAAKAKFGVLSQSSKGMPAWMDYIPK